MSQNKQDLIDFDDFGLDDLSVPEYANLSDLAQPVPSPPQTSLLPTPTSPPSLPVQPEFGPISPLQVPPTSFQPPLSQQQSASLENSPLKCGPGQDLHCSGFITTPTASSEICNPQNSHLLDVSADSSFMADDSLGLNAWERLIYLIENLNFNNDGITDEKMREYNKRISVYGHLVLPLSAELHRLEAEYHDSQGTLPADRVHSVRVVRMTPEQTRQFEAPDTLPTAPPNPQAASLPAWVYPNEGQSTIISIVDIMDLVQHLLTYTITMQEAYDIENRIDSAGYVIEFEEHQNPIEITDAGSRAAFSVRRIFTDDSIPPPLFDSREIDRLHIVTQGQDQGQGQSQGQGERQDTKNLKYKSWSPYETVWRPSDYCSRSLGGVSEENSADVNAFLQDSNLNSTRASSSPPGASLHITNNNNNLAVAAPPPGSPGSVQSPQAASCVSPQQDQMQNSYPASPPMGPTEHGPAQISPTRYSPPPPRPGPRNLREVLLEGQQYTSNQNNSDIHISFLESPDAGNITHAQNQNIHHALGASHVENDVTRPSPPPNRFMQRSPSQFRPETRTFAQVLQHGQNYVAQHNASSDGSSIFASPLVDNRTQRQSPGSISISPSVKAEAIHKISDILDKTNLTDEEASVIDADLSKIDCKLLLDLSEYEFLSFADAIRLYGIEELNPAGLLIRLIEGGDTFEEGEIEGYNRIFARTGHGLRLDPLARTAAELEMEVRLMNRDTVPWRCRLVHTGDRRIFQREPPSHGQGQGQGHVQGQGPRQGQGMSPRLPPLTRQSYPPYERNPGALISATPPRHPQVRVELELREPLQPLPTFFGNPANTDSFKSSSYQSPIHNQSYQHQPHLESLSGSPRNFNDSNNSNSTSNSSAYDVDYWSAFLDLIQDLNFNNQGLTSDKIHEYNNIANIYGHFIGPASRELYMAQDALQENLEPYERRYTCRVFRMKAAQRAENNVENTAPVPPPPDSQLPLWVYESQNPGMDEIMELVVYLLQFTITMQEAHDLEHRLNSIGFEIGFDERPDHIPDPDVARNLRAGFHVLRIHEGDPVRPPLFNSLEQRRLKIVARDVVSGMDLHPKAITVKKGLKPRNWQNSLDVVNEENRAELEGYLRAPSSGLNSNLIPLPPISGPMAPQQQQQSSNVCASPAANAYIVAPPPPLPPPMPPCSQPQQFNPTNDGSVSPLSFNISPVSLPPRRCSRTSITQGTKGGRSSYGTRNATHTQASSDRDEEQPLSLSRAFKSKSRVSQNRRGSHTFNNGGGSSGALALSGRPGNEVSLQSPSPEQLNGTERYINCSRSNGTNEKAGGVTCTVARRSPISHSLSQQEEPQGCLIQPQSHPGSPLLQNSNLDNNSSPSVHHAENSAFGSPLLHNLPQPQPLQLWTERSVTQQQGDKLLPGPGSNIEQIDRTTTMTFPPKHMQSVMVKTPPGILCASTKTKTNSNSSPGIGEQQNVSLRENQPPVFENPQLQIGNKIRNEDESDPLLESTSGGSKRSTKTPPPHQGAVDANNSNYNCGCSHGQLCTCTTCQFKPK